MAILYIGPHRNPDFANDYHLSPLLAPSHLLAQFPPLLMSCGEKDPFVDDTVIFAGRLRDAKRSRKLELDALLAGPASKLPETLRMSTHDVRDDVARSLRRERDRLAAQGDEDWVTMQIFSDWSHGYLQMAMLMNEARTVIYDMADWIDEAFAGHIGKSASSSSSSSKKSSQMLASGPPNGGHSVVPAQSDEEQTPFTSETEVTDTDDAITFVPKRRSPPSSFGSAFGKSKTSPTLPVEDRRSRSRVVNRTTSGLNGNAMGSGFHGTPNEDLNNAETFPANFPLHLPLPPEVYLATDDVNRHHQHQHDASSDLISSSPSLLTNGGKVPHSPQTQYANGSPRNMAGSPPRAGTPGKAGPTITESELMRRRRLLDSHLIPSTSGDVVSPPT